MLVKHGFFNTSIAIATEAWRINSVLISRYFILTQMQQVIIWLLSLLLLLMDRTWGGGTLASASNLSAYSVVKTQTNATKLAFLLTSTLRK